MADPKRTETEAERAARIRRIEESVKKAKSEKGIMPSTPEEAREMDELSRQLDENQRRHEKEFRGLKLPPKKDEPRSR